MNQQITKKIIDRSSSYPVLTIDEALEDVAKLRQAYSTYPFSRQQAAKALGHQENSGTSARKVAALTQFGLLLRDGNTYKVSGLAGKILYHTDEVSKEQAIIEAVSSPKLYRALIDKFSNQALPLLLNNILVANFGINSKVSKAVAKDFVNSLEYARLLKNGVIATVESKTSSGVSGPVSDTATTKATKETYETSSDFITLPLPSGIVISFPQVFSGSLALGSFTESLKSIENKASEILNKT